MPLRFIPLCLLALFASGITAKAALPTSAFKSIDLRTATNMAFADEKADDRKGGWTDQGPANDMRLMPLGRQEWGGVPFDIIDPEKNNGTACIVLRGKPRAWLPLESPVIRVDAKGSAIYFVGTCAWTAAPGEDVLRLVVTYVEDTRYSESAFVYGRHFAGWWNPRPQPLGDVAFEVFNGATTVGLYRFGWINPYPEKTIAGIKLISAATGAVPIVVAATLVRDTPETSALINDIKRREESLAKVATPTTRAIVRVDTRTALRDIPPALISVANGSSSSPAYAGPSRMLLEAGHGAADESGLPPRPFYRIQTHAVEPSPAEGVWDFSQLDRIINAAISYGAEPMICLSFPPRWLLAPAPSYAEARRLRKPYDIEAYAAHCAEIVRHYTLGRPDSPVLWWEIGNEVELHDWSYAYYIKVYQAVARRLRAIDPRIRLGGPVTAGPNPGWAGELLRALPNEVDFIGYHQYGYSEPFDTPDPYIMSRTPLFESTAKRYRALIKEISPSRDLPLILTETNSSWRYHEGTDPRIRQQFGAAWFASAAGRYLNGGGDAICYFTLNGGFGSIWEDKADTVVFPVWHAMWLYRNFLHGSQVTADSDAETVEAYAWHTTDSDGVMLINKNNHPVTVRTTFAGLSRGKVLSYALNEETYRSVRIVDPVNGTVPTLSPDTLDWSGDALETVLQPFEVRALRVVASR